MLHAKLVTKRKRWDVFLLVFTVLDEKAYDLTYKSVSLSIIGVIPKSSIVNE